MTDSNNIPSSKPTNRDPGTISSGLLRNVQADGQDAWTRMSNLYAPLVYYWCVRQGLQPNDADDIVQEVFRAVAARIDGFRRELECDSFRGWLRTITRNKIGDFLRKRRREFSDQTGEAACQLLAGIALDENGAEDDEDSLSIETKLLYARVLELIRTEFQQRTWRACLRVVVDGATPQEVADELGISVNSVYLAKSRVLRRVRDELSEVLR